MSDRVDLRQAGGPCPSLDERVSIAVMPDRPTLCVLMPNYNHARFLPESLEAILAQSYPPLEVIVLDDASTDNSVEVIESFLRRDPRVRLVRNERNVGVERSVNRLVEMPYTDGHCYGFTYQALGLRKIAGISVPGNCAFAGWETLQDSVIRPGVPSVGSQWQVPREPATEPAITLMNA